MCKQGERARLYLLYILCLALFWELVGRHVLAVLFPEAGLAPSIMDELAAIAERLGL